MEFNELVVKKPVSEQNWANRGIKKSESRLILAKIHNTFPGQTSLLVPQSGLEDIQFM